MSDFSHKKITDVPYKLKKKKSKWRYAFWLLYLAVGSVILGTVTLFGMIVYYNASLPAMDELKNITIAQNTQILDRNEEILHNIQGDENRKYVPIAEISQNLVNATIAIEDDEFYEHVGFDIPAIAKSVISEVFGVGQRRGGSTITQQFVKNYFLTRERTYSRKLKELILAVKIERALTKDEILELYLNKIPYGNNAYGIQQAAKVYFDKDAKDLTVAESAILAALPQAPSYYSPYGPRRYTTLDRTFTEDELKARPVKAMTDLEEDEFTRGLLGKSYDLVNGESVYVLGRSDLVLHRMKNLGMINEDQFKAAQKEVNEAIEFKPHRQSFTAPHFIFYVREYLEEKYGKEVVEQGGLRVITTLDRDLQIKAEEIVEKYAKSNLEKYDAENAALLASDPKTGQILAMVGSADFFDPEIEGQVNITDQKLQPGSSFKPIVYAAAFLNRYSPGTVVYDAPTKFGNSSQKIQNFDGKFFGPISLRSGLALSRNIPAIKAFYLAGLEEPIVSLAKDMGISTLRDDGTYGVSIALGTGKTKLTEMLAAYGVFATNGIYKPLSPILRIENADGEVLEEWVDSEGEQVLDEQVAYLINNVLSDPNINLGPRMRVSGHSVAAKTGTANKKLPNGRILPSNTWTIGYTPNIVVGAWSGNADGRAMKLSASGYNNAAPIFNEFLREALKEKSPEPFAIPKGIKHITVSKASGLLPSPDTPDDQVRSEVFASFAVPIEEDDRFYKVNVDKMSKRIATEFTPKYLVETKTFLVHKPAMDNSQWQSGINTFVANMHAKEPNNPLYQEFPTETDHIHTKINEAKAPTLEIISPTSFSDIAAGNITVEVNINAPHNVDNVEFFLNGDMHYQTADAPYTGRLRVHPSTASGTLLKIKARVTDNFGYRGEETIDVKIQ